MTTPPGETPRRPAGYLAETCPAAGFEAAEAAVRPPPSWGPPGQQYPGAVGLGVSGLLRTTARGTRGRGLAVTGIVTGAIGSVVLVLFVLGILLDTGAWS